MQHRRNCETLAAYELLLLPRRLPTSAFQVTVRCARFVDDVSLCKRFLLFIRKNFDNLIYVYFCCYKQNTHSNDNNWNHLHFFKDFQANLIILFTSKRFLRLVRDAWKHTAKKRCPVAKYGRIDPAGCHMQHSKRDQFDWLAWRL
jgi:hypothetical protein